MIVKALEDKETTVCQRGKDRRGASSRSRMRSRRWLRWFRRSVTRVHSQLEPNIIKLRTSSSYIIVLVLKSILWFFRWIYRSSPGLATWIGTELSVWLCFLCVLAGALSTRKASLSITSVSFIHPAGFAALLFVLLGSLPQSLYVCATQAYPRWRAARGQPLSARMLHACSDGAMWKTWWNGGNRGGNKSSRK